MTPFLDIHQVFCGRFDDDDQMACILDAIQDMGEPDDTLVIYIQGDNGASTVNGPAGSSKAVAGRDHVRMRTRAFPANSISIAGAAGRMGEVRPTRRWRELDSNSRFRARFGSVFVVSLFALRFVAEA
jgi:arylsulfatase A-like enzyme